MVSPAAAPRIEVAGDSKGWLAQSLRLPTAALVATGMLLSGALLTLLALLPPPPSDLQNLVPSGRLTLRIPVFFAVLVGVYVASVPIAVRNALRSVDGLPGLDDRAREDFARELVRLPRRWLWGGVVLGCVLHLRILIEFGVPWDVYSRTDLLATRFGFVTVMGWVHAPAIGLAVSVLLRQGLLFLRIGREVGPVNLLDYTALAPFVHASLRLSLLFTLWVGSITAFHVDWSGSIIHQRLVAERNAELARVNASIRGDRHALRDSLVAADAEALNAVDLLAYREHVRSFSTWPFDASALLRLGLYLGIPLLSWVGAAIVERGIGVLLD
jgi:hypothetical protein